MKNHFKNVINRFFSTKNPAQNQQKKGFTLIELIVTMVVGSIIIASVLGAYASLRRAEIRLSLQRQLVQDVSLLLAKVGDNAREKPFEIDTTGEIITFTDSSPTATVLQLLPDGKLQWNGEPVLPEIYEVVDFTPIIIGSGAVQPRLSLYFTAKHRATQLAEKVFIDIQTSFTSRILQ